MAEYFCVAIPSQGKVYKLGTISSARRTFPLLLNNEGAYESIILCGDETHSRLQDKFEYDVNQFEYEYGVNPFEMVDYDSYPNELSETVEQKAYTEAEFRVVFNEFGGKLVRKVNKFDFIEG